MALDGRELTSKWLSDSFHPIKSDLFSALNDVGDCVRTVGERSERWMASGGKILANRCKGLLVLQIESIGIASVGNGGRVARTTPW